MLSEESRIHVYIARLGLGSRREVEEQIRQGKVRVNGKPAQLGQKINPASDQIVYRSKVLPKAQTKDFSLVALNKPKGVISSVRDPQGRKTVLDLLPKRFRHLYPVGRLDLQSEGLMLLTNDGELALRLTHPRYETPKLYEVKIRGDLGEKKIEHLEKGVRVGREKWKGVKVLNVYDVTKSGTPKFKVRLEITEGKNRHIRKLFEAISCRVTDLRRIKISGVSVKGIARGEFRVLSNAQRLRLRKEVGLGEL